MLVIKSPRASCMLLRNISCSFGGKSAEAWPRTDNTTRDFTLTRTLTSEVGPGVGDGFSPRHVLAKRKNKMAKRGVLFPIGVGKAFIIFLPKNFTLPTALKPPLFFYSQSNSYCRGKKRPPKRGARFAHLHWFYFTPVACPGIFFYDIP